MEIPNPTLPILITADSLGKVGRPPILGPNKELLDSNGVPLPGLSGGPADLTTATGELPLDKLADPVVTPDTLADQATFEANYFTLPSGGGGTVTEPTQQELDDAAAAILAIINS